MIFSMDTEYFAQKIQCTRDDKEDCLQTVRQLLELAYTSRERGLLAMDEMVQDTVRYPDAFLRKAVQLTVEIADSEKIRKVLYNLIVTTKFMANHHFLKDVLITETMIALCQGEDLDYLFAHLLPSYFGLEYFAKVEDLYYAFKEAVVRARTGEGAEEGSQG